MSQKAMVLMYHNICVPPQDAGLRSLYVTPRMFRYQMWYLRAAGFRVAPLEVVADFAEAGGTEKIIALTFDDGFEDFFHNAYPVLREYGYPSTVFIVSDRVGGENRWDAGSVGVRKRLLTWEQINELKNNNVTFGSHTRTHPFLSRLVDEQIAEEVAGSKRTIEERLNLPADTFCYPYGDYDSRVAEAVRNAGYRCAVTTKRGRVLRGDSLFELRRSFIRLNTHPLLFSIKLHTAYEDRKGGRR
ncbi:MAG: polysaccharide deacetylase family protein [Nitrospiraceae bacterium]|nr:polysaccharide deacetylase family protein [Nitrospiraceae bacterium]